MFTVCFFNIIKYIYNNNNYMVTHIALPAIKVALEKMNSARKMNR